MRKFTLWKAALIGAMSLAAAGAAFAQDMRTVTIANSSPGIGAASGRVAKELGLFEQYNIDPTFVVMDSSSTALAALISGSAQVAVAGTPDLIIARSNGQDIVALATSYNGFAGTVVLAKSIADDLDVGPDAPFEDKFRALEGLLIASPGPSTIGSVVVNGAADALGVEIRSTYLTQPAMPAALTTGAIDGFQASAPAWALPVVDGSGVLWISGPRGEFPDDLGTPISAQLQTTRAFAEANPELVRDLAQVWADLAQAVTDRPDEVKATIGKLYPDLDAATLDVIFAAESAGWQGEQATPEVMARMIDVARASGAQLGSSELVPEEMLYP